MCRIAAYLGPPAPLSALLYEPPRSLEVQAFAPREMVSGTVNVDGTGVAWWPALGRAEPLRYVTERTPWGDANLPYLAPRVRAAMQLHVVRSATPGIPVGPGQVHPFVRGDVAMVHNGFLKGFRGPVGRALLAALPDEHFARYDAVSDSLALFLLTLARLDDAPGAGLASALESALEFAAATCLAADEPGVLNAVLADGAEIVAARAAVNAPSNTLYVLEDGIAFPGAVVLASEPLDEDPGWRSVPDSRMIVVTPSGVRDAPLILRDPS